MSMDAIIENLAEKKQHWRSNSNLTIIKKKVSSSTTLDTHTACWYFPGCPAAWLFRKIGNSGLKK